MKLLRFSVLGIIGLVVMIILVMIGMPILSRPGSVNETDFNACLHYDNQTIVSKVVAARVGSREGFKSFSEVQDAAQRANLLVNIDNVILSNNIWMVPFSQHSDESGTQQGMALLDCSRDNVEFSGS